MPHTCFVIRLSGFILFTLRLCFCSSFGEDARLATGTLSAGRNRLTIGASLILASVSGSNACPGLSDKIEAMPPCRRSLGLIYQGIPPQRRAVREPMPSGSNLGNRAIGQTRTAHRVRTLPGRWSGETAGRRKLLDEMVLERVARQFGVRLHVHLFEQSRPIGAAILIVTEPNGQVGEDCGSRSGRAGGRRWWCSGHGM
jgi:hypothetical protein